VTYKYSLQIKVAAFDLEKICVKKFDEAALRRKLCLAIDNVLHTH
jgi:hypothetical protein